MFYRNVHNILMYSAQDNPDKPAFLGGIFDQKDSSHILHYLVTNRILLPEGKFLLEEDTNHKTTYLDRLLLWGGPQRTIPKNAISTALQTLADNPGDFFIALMSIRKEDQKLMEEILSLIKVEARYASGWYAFLACTEFDPKEVMHMIDTADEKRANHPETLATMRKFAEHKAVVNLDRPELDRLAQRIQFIQNLQSKDLIPPKFSVKKTLTKLRLGKAISLPKSEGKLAQVLAYLQSSEGKYPTALLRRDIPRDNLLCVLLYLPMKKHNFNLMSLIYPKLGREEPGYDAKHTTIIQTSHSLIVPTPLFYDAMSAMGINLIRDDRKRIVGLKALMRHQNDDLLEILRLGCNMGVDASHSKYEREQKAT